MSGILGHKLFDPVGIFPGGDKDDKGEKSTPAAAIAPRRRIVDPRINQSTGLPRRKHKPAKSASYVLRV